jgi:cbb3-type cytochrome oxidase subunit 3
LRFIGLSIVLILFKASKKNILDQEKNVIFLPSSGCGSRLAEAAI